MIDLRLGDCLDIMRGMDADSVDAVVTDPPYGLSFMGKDWDHGVPGIHFWTEALRVAKPGAYLLAFGGTRTYHRLVCAIEDAGFEIRDTIEWVYGSGFPKSLDVSKAIDKAAGAERQDAGPYIAPDGNGRTNDTGITSGRFGAAQGETWQEKRLTYPSTNAAREWSGWGTALKPAHEPIVVARKPLSEATVAANVLRWGTGALNIDAGRVETDNNESNTRTAKTKPITYNGNVYQAITRNGNGWNGATGRFPANLITDGSAEVVAMFPSPHGAGNAKPAGGHNRTDNRSIFDNSKGGIGQGDYGGMRHGDTGSASRFFAVCPLDEDDYPPLYYCAKASKAERDAGCEGIDEKIAGRLGNQMIAELKRGKHPEEINAPLNKGSGLPKYRNHHPTVKPLSLMRYLITLCTREGATVLDPFMGSGTTGIACVQLNRNFIGCEIDSQYFEIAKRRIEAAQPIAIELPFMAEI